MQKDAETPREELALLLDRTIKQIAASGSPYCDSRFKFVRDLVQHLRVLKLRVERGDPGVLRDCVFEFVATNSVCGTAIENGWADEYMSLANRSGELCEILEKKPY